MLRGASQITGRLGATAGGLSTTGLVGIGGTIAAARLAYKAWSEHHQEMLENARKQATERSGIQSRAAQLNNKLNAELEKERIRDIYAIEQKRAENAKALHMMKATNVASELRYQREIFAIEERRFENEKKIAALKTRAKQLQQRTNLAFDELEKQGAARDSAHIVRRWWWADKTVDANGNKIDHGLARAAMFGGMWHGRSTTDANFAALQSLAKDIRATIISGFREGSEIMSTKLSAALDKLSALGSDAYSDELRSEFNRVQAKVAVAQQQKANAMYAINYDEMMRMSEEEAIKAGKLKITADGKYEFYDADGDAQAISKSAFRKKKKQHLKNNPNGYAPVVLAQEAEEQANMEVDLFSAKADVAARVQGVANERLKKELEGRKEISERRREKYVSDTADVIGQYNETGRYAHDKLLARNRQLYQDYALNMVKGDAETTQRMKESFAIENATQEANDKAEEKAASERRDLAIKNIVEAGKLWVRSAQRATQASIGIKEAQAELTRKINQFQLDVELANADTYGKSIWETQKAVNKANFGARHQENLTRINERYINRERAENDQLDEDKRAAVKELDEKQAEKRLDLERQLIEAQRKYRIAEIDYEYRYREKLEEEYNKRRESKRKAWLQGVTKEEVKSLIGVDKEVSELTIDEQDKLAQTRKAQAELAGDMDSLQEGFGVKGQSREDFTKTLDQTIANYKSAEQNINNIKNDAKEVKDKYINEQSLQAISEIEEEMRNEGLAKYKSEGSTGAHGHWEYDTKEWEKRLAERKEQILKDSEDVMKDYIDKTYGSAVEYNADTGVAVLSSDYRVKAQKAEETKNVLQWQTEHATDIANARIFEANEDSEFDQARERIEKEARDKSRLNQAISERELVDRNVSEEKAQLDVDKEKLEHEYEDRGKREEHQRNG